MKTLSMLLATCYVGLCSPQIEMQDTIILAEAAPIAAKEQAPQIKVKRGEAVDFKAGDYLSSRFAQTNHDWKSANAFIDDVIATGITQDDILQRAMVLAMGAGNVKTAIKRAKEAKLKNPKMDNSIADIFIIIDAVQKEQYKKAKALLKTLPQDGTVKFVGPFMEGWINAGLGQSKIETLRNNTVQLYHSILISDFLDDHSTIEKMIDNALKVDEINTNEMERIADLYGHVGLNDKASALYNKILKTLPDDENILNKLKTLESGTIDPLFQNIKSARHGMAQAFHDIANILYNETNDESARIFAHIALHLAPDIQSSRFLLARISARHKQYEEAISYYKAVPKDNPDHLKAQHDIVDIYEETEQIDQALNILKRLEKEDTTVDTLIKIGDLYRHQEDYKNALKSYQSAAKKLGGEIPEDYWHLHYVLGIAHEQLDNWPRAEQELQKALSFRPDQPYVLNYLGYAWADKGMNLIEAEDMIKRAVDARPNDGYITDSLGWVMYKTQDYQSAAVVLERAVELLPYDPTVNDHLGDAYWKVGRRLEARFQWERAKNFSKDPEQVKTIEQKLRSGLIDTKKNMK